MRRIIAILYIFLSLGSFAQQDAIYSQYMFNPFAINPAYAGSRDATSVILLNRSQWLGISGAPNTQTMAAHFPANKKHIAWGLNFSYDRLGPTSNLLAAGTVAYQLILEKGTLNFGLRGGAYNTVMNGQKLKFREEFDNLDHQTKISVISPTFDFGMYYYTDRFYAGISANHLTKHPLKFDNNLNNTAYFFKQHFFFMTGYAFELKKNIILKPSLLVKYTEDRPFNVDFNINMLLKERFWLGVGLRNLNSLNFLIDFNITDFMRIGYSYDMTMTEIKDYSNGSHEILLGFDFNLRKSTVISPRYL